MRTAASDDVVLEERIHRRFRICFVLALVLLCVCVWLNYALRPRAPTYQGKTAAQWFHEFQKASARYYYTPTIAIPRPRLPPVVSIRFLDERALQHDKAAQALCALGTNAALYLGKEYLKEDGWLNTNYGKLYVQIPGTLQKLLPEPAPPRRLVRMNIGYALEALGKDATPAVPALFAVFRRGNAINQAAALGILQKLPFDRHLLEPILEDWSRKGDHANVVLMITQFQVRTPMAFAFLMRAMSEGDVTVRCSSLSELERWGPAAAAALSYLIAALTDTDDETRYMAARVLVAIGPEATPAIPALILATADSSVMVQRASARALLAIQGQSQD
jgi:hypothetical protein